MEYADQNMYCLLVLVFEIIFACLSGIRATKICMKHDALVVFRNVLHRYKYYIF